VVQDEMIKRLGSIRVSDGHLSSVSSSDVKSALPRFFMLYTNAKKPR
jgi:hypothetical protein